MSVDPVVATTALGLAVVLCIFAWFASRRIIAVSLPFAVTLASLAVFIPLGRPVPMNPPAGDYTIIGAKIEVNVAIWVLLDNGSSEPRFYRLKYTNETANQLQGAKDATQGTGQSPHARIDGEGGAEFDGPPPQSDNSAPKQVERPLIGITP